MKKTLLLLTIVFLSCNSKIDNSEIKIVELQKRNDSLKSIIDTLNSKFIFDDIKVRFIANENNNNKLNSDYNGEFVIVAYNHKDKIKFATELEANKADFKNPEILKRDFGGYPFKLKLKNQENDIFVQIVSGNKYGKNYTFDGITFADKKTVK
jgi:hypothetical protein